ncbi:MAG TPA: tRNA(Ile)(2)-agmatinylcytidine synthase [Candidatus Nitrosopolaris sp.]|nr:tRNA(Ile)(2)-agmatinylcytidine synthase [Candidatus Nitrosopolaris sp.]
MSKTGATTITPVSDLCTRSQNEILHIGFDDTDSIFGKCTTYLAFKITGHLLKNPGTKFLDYPLLVRLNPNIPFKTRGNGAVCLRVMARNHEEIIQDIRQIIEEESATGMGANPGLAFLNGGLVPESLKHFSRIAMFDILNKEKAEKIAKETCVRHFTFGNGQGIVGSLAAIGSLQEGDHTFEAIAYRKSKNYGTTRQINTARVIQYDKKTFPNTFNNYDQNHGRVLIAPHGPDPVFCGIRGESPEVVVSSLEWLQQEEILDGYMVFRSNQGTNMHLQNELKLSTIRVYMAGYVRGKVISKPQTIQGGHVFFGIEDSGCITGSAAVYEPTGLTNIASRMEIGDEIEIGCGVRKATKSHPPVLNVEYISILNIVQTYDLTNPSCRRCAKKMKSEGKNKGFQCDRCRYKDGNAKKIPVLRDRNLLTGLYIPTPKSHRHLTKPFHRYGMEKKSLGFHPKSKLIAKWFFTSS